MTSEDLVILVDDNDTPVGTAVKSTVHTATTPLHRAFSLFLFNSRQELLVTKRSPDKKTFPGVWTNTVCGHPLPEEDRSHAAARRLMEEIGIHTDSVKKVADYRYRFADSNGIVENEICPIYIAYADAVPAPDPAEISEWKWVPWDDFLRDIRTNSAVYSPWCVEETEIIFSAHIL